MRCSKITRRNGSVAAQDMAQGLVGLGKAVSGASMRLVFGCPGETWSHEHAGDVESREASGRG